MLPEFDERGHLPPGRFTLSMEEAEEFLVAAPRFAASMTRPALWSKFQDFLYLFVRLQDTYLELLDGIELVHGVWLGGSFASAKLDPRNIDATVLVDERAEQALKGHPGSKWLTEAFKSRKAMLDRFDVSPMRVGYRPVASVFKLRDMTQEDRTYFLDRGRWDDWWQRCRLPGEVGSPPSEASAAPMRGYVEVRP